MYIINEEDGQYWVSVEGYGKVPYHAKLSTYEGSDPYDHKYKAFWNCTLNCPFYDWFYIYSNTKRKELKRMITAKNSTFVNPEVKDTGWVNVGPGAFARSIVATGQIKAPNIDSPTKEDTMDNYTTEKTQRDFLLRELEKASYAHEAKIDEHFHITDDRVTDIDDALERIKAGKIKVTPKSERKAWDSMWEHIRFREHEADQAGHDKAHEAMSAARNTVRQDIAILEPVKGLKSVRDFAKESFH